MKWYNEICAILRYYAAQSGNSVPMFRENLSVLSSRVKKSLTLEDGTEIVLKRRYRITTLRCVIFQKSVGLIYIVAEA